MADIEEGERLKLALLEIDEEGLLRHYKTQMARSRPFRCLKWRILKKAKGSNQPCSEATKRDVSKLLAIQMVRSNVRRPR